MYVTTFLDLNVLESKTKPLKAKHSFLGSEVVQFIGIPLYISNTTVNAYTLNGHLYSII